MISLTSPTVIFTGLFLQAGYTFLCEGWTLEGALPAGKYRLRMVGDSPDLLTPVRDIASSGVESNEIKEYYTPERNNIIFRYFSFFSFPIVHTVLDFEKFLAEEDKVAVYNYCFVTFHVPRYSVNVAADTPATVQVSTSKSDVNFRAEVCSCLRGGGSSLNFM